MRRLTTAKAVVDHLGGLSKVAVLTDTNINTAKNCRVAQERFLRPRMS
ncbi:hypothetical protein ABIF69_000690 [Bradyrhizobium japonicum]